MSVRSSLLLAEMHKVASSQQNFYFPSNVIGQRGSFHFCIATTQMFVMSRVLCPFLAVVCAVVLMTPRCSAQNCFSVDNCITTTGESFANCNQTSISCSNSGGCFSSSMTTMLLGRYSYFLVLYSYNYTQWWKDRWS